MKKLTKVSKKKMNYYITVIGAASLVSLLVIFLLVWLVNYLGQGEQDAVDTMSYNYSDIEVKRPAIQEKLLTKNVNSRPGTALNQVKGIVVHYTANPGTDAEANRNYFESRKDCADESSNKVSSHFIIGLDGTIIQCIPENEIAYASNKRNADTISIECCHPGKSGKFTKATYQALIHLSAYLCSKYEIATDNVIRHYDVTGKICPKYFVKHPDIWTTFQSDIFKFLKKSVKKET